MTHKVKVSLTTIVLALSCILLSVVISRAESVVHYHVDENCAIVVKPLMNKIQDLEAKHDLRDTIDAMTKDMAMRVSQSAGQSIIGMAITNQTLMDEINRLEEEVEVLKKENCSLIDDCVEVGADVELLTKPAVSIKYN